MFIKKSPVGGVSENDVTDESLYLSRRSFIARSGLLAGSALLGLQACSAEEDSSTSNSPANRGSSALADKRTLELLDATRTSYDPGEDLTPREAVTGYNNFYEFGLSKDDPKRYAHNMSVEPWTVEVTGAVEKPGTYDFDQLIDRTLLEERIYRLRCVEAWSMIIPWIGVPLASIIKKLGPTSRAKYVAFETRADRSSMRGLYSPVLDWPYVEGLRMDEAMNELTLMATGLYGQELPNQNGAPMRLVVPWKYGFKSIKSIVRISFVEDEPPTAWNKSNPREYGFYSNVNPTVDHPRWSQARERRIGEFSRRETLMFNGYGEQVADLYRGMDLQKYF